MLMTMQPDIQRNLENLSAYDMLKELKTLMKIYIDNLEFLGHPVSLSLSNYNMHGMGKTVNELHVMFKLHERMLPKKDDAPALHAIQAGKTKLVYAVEHAPAYAPKPKIPPPPKKDNPAKDEICHQCGDVDFRAIRIPLAIVVFYDYKIWQMDVKTANQCFAMKDLGEAAHILGIKIYKDRSRRLIGSSTPTEVKCMQRVPYTLAVGSLMYVVRCTRPDVAFAQNITSRFQQNPRELHWTAVKNILKYLRTTKDMFLVYGDVDDCKSHTRYVFVLNGGDVNRKSTKQSIFVTLSIKDEYIAASDASKEAVWIRKFIYGLGVIPTIEEPMKMYCDNTGAITIANEIVITKGAIHYHAKVHYLHEVIEFGDIKLVKVHTDDNLVDPFTKALPFNKHFEHTKNIEDTTRPSPEFIRVMAAPTVSVSTDYPEESIGDTIDIGVDVIHPVLVTSAVFPASTVMMRLAEHGEAIHDMAETERITLHARVRSLEVVEIWLHGIVRDEREARARIEHQLGLVQEELESLRR
ncbi:hypothetical protein Tco_0796678 [Tanacetum coccineum]